MENVIQVATFIDGHAVFIFFKFNEARTDQVKYQQRIKNLGPD